jgi:hypothetical protein
MLANHERANRVVLASAAATVRAGRFRAVLALPASLLVTKPTLRVYAVNGSDEALAVRRLDVRKAP